MDNHPAARKRGTSQSFEAPTLQVPHMARMAQAATTESTKKQVDASLPAGGILRAQLKVPVSLPSFYANGGAASLQRSHTAEKARSPQLGGGFGAKRVPPSSWDESLTAFLSRFCSPHQFGLESLSVWHDEQWYEAEGYIKYLAQQLEPFFTSNLASLFSLLWLMTYAYNCLACLGSEVDTTLRNLQFILRVLLKGLCLTLDSERMAKVLADRPIAPGAMDLMADKCGAMDDGEVRAYAFRQTLADSTPLYRQMLHYTILAISRLDIRGLQSAYAFYQDLLAMMLDLAMPQASRYAIEPEGASVFVCELVETIGPANTFNVECSQADMLIRSLLMNAVDAPPAPSAQGLVLSAYSYLFSRQSASTQSKLFEQHSLLLLLLLVSQPVDTAKRECNPYLHALTSIKDVSEVAASKLDGYGTHASVSFSKLFAKLVAELQSIEWAVLFQVLVSQNEAFRTYVLSRTDTDTLVMPLLRLVSMATALPIPSSAAQTQHAVQTHAQHGHKRNAGGGSGGVPGRRPGDKFVGSTLASVKPVEFGAPAYATLAAEPTALGATTTEQLAYPRSISQAQSPSSKHSTGATTTASSTPAVGSSPRSKIRQGALLPYAITVENMPYVHLYLWLDILLLLSADAQFVEQLGRTPVEFWPSSPQPMHKQPQSHCIVVEAMRVFQLNIMLLKDNQIHKLSMGILVNVLNQTTNVTTAIAQKLVKLFEMIYKRYSKLDSLPGSDPEELSVYAEVLTVLLALFCRLVNTNNPQFIYCLLQARDILGAFREDHASRPELQTADRRRAVAVAAEVRVRVAYFHARIAALPNGSQAKSILQLIESVVAGEGGRSQTRADFISSPQRHGHQCSAFMLPMAWELVLSSSIATADDVSAGLLEEFERLML
ncbi:hypothetical protein GGI20_000010 [Coemansia sp. BCRC 34301]|nr:hypothetical protein GGI20_000010 [Coemansia sp. BCRC 34301]